MVAHTWVMVKYDVQQVLVAPGDVELVLLEKRHQDFLPAQCSCCHVILDWKIAQSWSNHRKAQFNYPGESILLSTPTRKKLFLLMTLIQTLQKE